MINNIILTGDLTPRSPVLHFFLIKNEAKNQAKVKCSGEANHTGLPTPFLTLLAAAHFCISYAPVIRQNFNAQFNS